MKILCGPPSSSWSRIAKQLAVKYRVEVTHDIRDTAQEIIVPVELLSAVTKEYKKLYIFISTKYQIDKVKTFSSNYSGEIYLIYHTTVSPSPLLPQPYYQIDATNVRTWVAVLNELVPTHRITPTVEKKQRPLGLLKKTLTENTKSGRIAFLILAHKDTPQLKWACENLNTDKSTVFIHFDAKGKLPEYCHKSVVVPYRTEITWSSPEMVTATLNSMQFIETSGIEYDHLFLMSGEDLLLVNVDQLISEIKHDVYIEAVEINSKSDKTQHERTARVSKRYFISGHPFANMKCGFGSQWFSCSRRAVRYLLSHEDTPLLMDFYRTTRFSDESFFQTFFLNSPLEVCLDNKRFIKWSGGKHPEYIDDATIPNGSWIARKVQTRVPSFKNKYLPPKLKQIQQSGLYCGESQSKFFKATGYQRTSESCSVFFIKSWSQLSLVKDAMSRVSGDIILVASDPNTPAGVFLPNCAVVTYDAANFIGKVFGLNLGTFIALNLGYKKIFVSMCDVKMRGDGFSRLLKENDLSVPYFYTKGVPNLDGQWEGMQTQKMLHYELLCWMVPAEIVSVCRPSDKFPTSWATGLKYGIDLTNKGFTITKHSDIFADHEGGTTFGVKAVTSQFKDRKDYHKAGATELLLLLREYYNSDLYNLLHAMQSQTNFVAETSRWKWLWYQLEAVVKYGVLTPITKTDTTVFIFHSLHQGGIEKVWASLGKAFKELNKKAVFIYWDDRPPHKDFDDLTKIKIKKEHLQAVLSLLNPKNAVACHWSIELHRSCDSLKIKKFSYVASPDYNQKECAGTIKIFESKQLLEKGGIFLPQLISTVDLGLKREFVTRVGRICESKNPRLFGKIARNLPGTKFIWVGGPERGSEKLFESMKELYPEILWAGDCSREEVTKYLSMSFVSLSTTHTHIGSLEGIPNAIIESLACGTPVISTDSGNCKEVATIIVEENVDSFVSAIKQIQKKDISNECRELIRNRHNKDKIYKTISEIF